MFIPQSLMPALEMMEFLESKRTKKSGDVFIALLMSSSTVCACKLKQQNRHRSDVRADRSLFRCVFKLLIPFIPAFAVNFYEFAVIVFVHHKQTAVHMVFLPDAVFTAHDVFAA